jgi:hypothetical protein
VLQRYGVVMVMMKVLVMMVMKMMIPMKPNWMAMTMATISPLWEGISLADFYRPESFLSLCVFHPAEAAESISDPPRLRFWGTAIYARGAGRGGLGQPHHWVAWPRAGPRHLAV